MRIKREFAVAVVTDPMEVVRREVYGRGALEAFAESLGKSHQTVSKQINEQDGNCLRLREAVAFEAFFDTDALAECFAARRRGVFIRLPEAPQGADAGVAGMVAIFSRLVQEFSQSSAAFSDSLQDGRIELAEVERLEKELRDVYAAGAQLVVAGRAMAKPKAQA